MSTTRPFAPDDRGPGHGDPADRAAAPTGSHAGSGAPGRDEVRIGLSQASGVVPLARDVTREAMHAWGWLPSTTAERRACAEDILLVVSELVTNACLHGGGPKELRLQRAPKHLRIEVTDGGSGDPAPRTPHRAGRPGGHGMFIVQRLSLDWGVVRALDGGTGKTVWAELAWPA
jgi:hypothetical protein